MKVMFDLVWMYLQHGLGEKCVDQDSYFKQESGIRDS
jgi:hypothetical protein